MINTEKVINYWKLWCGSHLKMCPREGCPFENEWDCREVCSEINKIIGQLKEKVK